MIEPYKRRTIRAEDVWVYRNLMRTDGVWYSILQRGLVVGHAREVAVTGARFVVRHAGRMRVLRTGVKNVHAFVVGWLYHADPASFAVPGSWTARGRYNPRELGSFVYDAGGTWAPVYAAAGAHLGAAGLTVYGPASESPTVNPRHTPP